MSDPTLDDQQLQARAPDRMPPWPPPVQYAAAASSMVAFALLAAGYLASGLGFTGLSIVLQIWTLAYSWGRGSGGKTPQPPAPRQ